MFNINVNFNNLGKDVGFRIMSALATNDTLTSLNMGNTELDQRGICALAIALRSNTTLRSVDISSPRLFSISEEATVHLAQALCENHTVEELSLAKHGTQDFGAEWLARALEANRGLTRLDLSGNKIGTTGCAALAAKLVQRPVGCIVELSYCPLRGQDFSEIQEALQGTEESKNLSTVSFHSDYMDHRLVSEPIPRRSRNGSRVGSRGASRNGSRQEIRPSSRQSTGSLNRVRFGDEPQYNDEYEQQQYEQQQYDLEQAQREEQYYEQQGQEGYENGGGQYEQAEGGYAL